MTTQRIFAALLAAAALIVVLVAAGCRTPEPTVVSTATPTPAVSPSPTATPTPGATPTLAVSPSPTSRPTPADTPTLPPAPTAAPPTATFTPPPTSTPLPPTDTPAPTYTPTPRPTNMAQPIPTYTPRPIPTPRPTNTAQPIPTYTPRLTPTPRPPTGSIVPTWHGKVGDWLLGRTAYSAYLGYSSQSVINDKDKKQQYTCIKYSPSEITARANLKFPYELNHRLIINAAGERQGAVNSLTTIDGKVVPVEWRTWVSRTDRLRARNESAILLVSEIAAQQATEFTLELPDNPELSATYSVKDFIEALDANQMTCFE